MCLVFCAAPTCKPTPSAPTHNSQDLKSNIAEVNRDINVPAVRALFQAVDWVGVSAYAGLPRYPTLSDIETSLKLVDQEMAEFGMSLKGLGKEIIFSEYGELPCVMLYVVRTTSLLWRAAF